MYAYGYKKLWGLYGINLDDDWYTGCFIMMLPRVWCFKFKVICSSNYASQIASLNLLNVPPSFIYNVPQTPSQSFKRSSTYAILKNAPNSDFENQWCVMEGNRCASGCFTFFLFFKVKLNIFIQTFFGLTVIQALC